MPIQSTRAARAAQGLFLVAAGVAALPQVQAQELAEIVVTARRQGEEKLMETPLAITAFDSNTIEKRNITNLQDVANLTPGLSFFNPLGENLPTPVIRGIVPQDIFGENAAAIFIDGVYVAGREGLNFSQLDIERIEVLKGPQSAAYGRNAFSGAINYVTRAPSDVFESKYQAEVGNRGRQKVSGEVSGPILDSLFRNTLSGRLAMLYDEWDGSYDNTFAPENDIGGYRYRSYQGKLRWQPADTLDVNFSLYRSNDEIDDSATGGLLVNCEDEVEQTSQNQSEGPGVRYQNWCGEIPRLKYLPQMLDKTQFPNPGPLAGSVRRDAMPKLAGGLGEDRDLVRSNLNVNWDTDYGSLSLLTGYSYMKQSMLTDFGRNNGDAIPIVYCTPSSNFDPPTCNPPFSWSRAPMGFIDLEKGSKVEEWSQELRFTSPRDQRLRWQAGGYYFHSTMDKFEGNPIAVTQMPGDYGPGGDIALGPVALPTSLAIGTYIFAPSMSPTGGFDPLSRPIWDSAEKSWSLFGALDFDVTDKLQARAELRYTQDAKEASAYHYAHCLSPTPGSSYPMATDIPVADCGDTFYDLRSVGPVGDSHWIKDDFGNYRLVPMAGVESGSARFDYYTGRVGLSYKMDSGWMAYGSVAYGEKPGGINVLAGKDVIDPTGGIRPATVFNTFDPEKMTAYELGLKGYTLDHRIRIDMAVFFNDWKDIVLRQLTETDPTSGLKFRQPYGINVNAGDSHVYGWELTADVGLTDNLTGRLTTSYTAARMKDARLDSLALFPSFYTSNPACAPAAIQTLTDPNPATSQNEAQDQLASQCRELSGDVSGHPQMRQPEWTASASLDYRRPVRGDWSFTSSLSGSYVGKIYVGNDSQSWVPWHANVNFNIGLESPRYTVQLWVRNLLDDDKPLAAFRDIFWTNDADMQALVKTTSGQTIRDVSTFDDFPPLRMSIAYPSLRTYGLNVRMRFGGAEQ